MITQETELPLSPARLTRYGRLRDRVLLSRRGAKIIRWAAPLAVVALAAVLRLTNLSHPGTLAFDETYYVKDAWSLWLLGYEGTWGEGANDAFANGGALALDPKGSFVVHPPLGKWIIALGMALGGPYDPGGWRLTTALFGVGSVLLVYLLARKLSGSIVTATVAGFLLAIDGVSIVMSRIALLDGILTFFILLGFLFVLLDRSATIPVLERKNPDDPEPFWGPVLWRRPWLISAGVALGAASAVKWSGLYALAGLGLYVVVSDALARRRAGVVYWPMSAAFRQGPASFGLLVVPSFLTYLLSWTGWILTTGGYGRANHANPFVALWKYHEQIMGFHVALTSGHPYASPAWQWPAMIRPTAVWVGGENGTCGSDHCIAVISTVPNPLIWYAGVAATIYVIYLLIRGWVKRMPVGPTLTLPLLGVLVTYGPWLLVADRTIFQFYTVALVPFIVLLLAIMLRRIGGQRDDPLHRRQSGERTVMVFLVFAVLLSAFFYPVWTGMNVPYNFWYIHNWMPTWV